MEYHLQKYSMGSSDFFMLYVDVNWCWTQKCRRHAQIYNLLHVICLIAMMSREFLIQSCIIFQTFSFWRVISVNCFRAKWAEEYNIHKQRTWNEYESVETKIQSVLVGMSIKSNNRSWLFEDRPICSACFLCINPE